MAPPDSGMIMATGEWRKLPHEEGKRVMREAAESGFVETKETMLRGLEFMRYECLDDLPAGKLEPSDPNYQLYKCRTHWIMGLFNRLQIAQLDGYITSPEAKAKIKELHLFLFNIHQKEKMRTPSDIAFLNDVLDVAIADMRHNRELLH